jgi:formylglycine-generating enzyme required for sulfatase activity
VNHAPAVALADLLRMSAALGEHAAERDAAFATAGFVRRTVSEKRRSDEAEFSAMWNSAPDELAPQVEDAADAPSGDPAAQDDRPWHWRVVSDMTNPDAPSKPLERPAWIDETPPATREELEAQPSPGPVTKRVPLMRPGRFAAYLRRHLARSVPGNEPDINRICRAWASGRALTRVPMQRVARWPARVRVVLDHAPAQRLYHDDLWPLIEQTQHLLGERVEVYLSEGGPGDLWCPEAGLLTRLPVAASGVLLLGTMEAQNDPRRAKAWARWVRVGVRLGEPVQMLTTGGRGVAQRLAGAGVRVEVLNDTAPGTGLADAEAAALSGWIACLHGNPCVTPEVLRTLRHALRGQGWPLALHHEAALFEDAVFQHAGTSMTIRRGYRLMVQKGFQALPETVRKVAVTVQMEALRRLSPLVLAEYIERIVLALSPDDSLMAQLAIEREWMNCLYRGMAASMAAEMSTGDIALRVELFGYLNRYGRRSRELLGKVPLEMQTAWALACRDRLINLDESFPEGINFEELAWIFGNRKYERRLLVQVNDDGKPVLVHTHLRHSDAQQGYLIDFSGGMDVRVWVEGESGFSWLRFGMQVPLDVMNRYRVETENRSVLIEAFQKPVWADRLWCEGNEWRVFAKGSQIAWTPLRSIDGVLRQGCWWDLKNRIISLDELAGCERDGHGFWFEFHVRSKSNEYFSNRMRWIPPGEFNSKNTRPGSGFLENEWERRIILTKGFWLADAACTQQLWDAVLNCNPSRFNDDPQNPVEQVSWVEVKDKFIPRLNELTGFNFLLPEESQWEYACRAGSVADYSFESGFNMESANYEGVRGQTVSVKRLAKNPWGLYQMHGNVWEWCNEDFSESQEEINLNGEQESNFGVKSVKVLRGGSWSDYRRYCSSSYRRGANSIERELNIGFRLAGVSLEKNAKIDDVETSSASNCSPSPCVGLSLETCVEPIADKFESKGLSGGSEYSIFRRLWRYFRKGYS